MTVGELISLLEDYPQSYRVLLEGCDCYGAASGGIEVNSDQKTLLLLRD